jgi:AcrR family transcriptional regulator
MRTHGWSGSAPASDEEAVARILAAASKAIDAHGADISIADVARTLGVTRQTVYRYFPSLADILRAVALAGVEEFAGRMERHLASFGSAAEAAVESVVFAVRTVPDEPYLGLLLQAGEADFFTDGVISPLAFAIGVRVLRNVPVDWAAVGVSTDDDFRGLAEILMRLFISFLQYPSTTALTDDGLRALVRRWLGPALRDKDS